MDGWGVLGTTSGDFWDVLGLRWGGFRYAKGILDALWVPLWGILRDFRGSLGHFGRVWRHLCGILEHLGGVLGVSWGVLEVPGACLRSFLDFLREFFIDVRFFEDFITLKSNN